MRECQELELKDGVPLIKGQVQISNGDIFLDRVPIVTPNCDIVVPSLSIKVKVYIFYSFLNKASKEFDLSYYLEI